VRNEVASRVRSLFSHLAGAVLLAVLAAPATALAQGGDKALAEELFRQGQALMQEERYAEACPKLAESQRLDPGTGTLLNLGVCHEREGKLASAWAEYNEVITFAQRDGRQDRVAYARERIAAVEPRLARLKIELSAGADVPGLEVRLDGNLVGRPALGVAVPVDPGPHEVAASAPGKLAWKSTAIAPEGPGRVAIVIPALEAAPEQAPAAATQATASAPTSDKPPADGKTQRIVAYVLGGVGVAGIGVGSVFGLNAIAKYDESNEQGCNGNQCPPAAAETRREAQSAGTISTVAFVIGGAALAGGVVLFLTAPSGKARATAGLSLAPGAGELHVGAVW
jgi:serine/threonine-protein kinase